MTPKMLEAAGLALYGPHWKTQVAALLGRTPKTVQRYMSKDPAYRSPIPEEHSRLVIEALKQKKKEVDAAYDLVTAYAKTREGYQEEECVESAKVTSSRVDIAKATASRGRSRTKR